MIIKLYKAANWLTNLLVVTLIGDMVFTQIMPIWLSLWFIAALCVCGIINALMITNLKDQE